VIRYHVEITKPAETDLQGIATYIAKELREPITALRMVATIGEAILDLEQLPLRNALVRDERLANQGMRMLIVDSYIVFYVAYEKDRKVIIVRILYGKREWSNIL
jgi:toxin ParE1/3/4